VQSFQKIDKNSTELWQNFADSQEEDGVADKVRALLLGNNVAEVAAFVVNGGEHDRRPFGADASLMARMKDGSFCAGLRRHAESPVLRDAG
jgi:hypothetical protein